MPFCALQQPSKAYRLLTRGKRRTAPGSPIPKMSSGKGPVASGASATADAASAPQPDSMGTIVDPSVANMTAVRAAVLLGVTALGFGSASAAPQAVGAALHVAAAGTWLGVNVWTTFFAGITMFKSLPRQMFGKLQAKLFPLYFSCITVCCAMLIGSLQFGALAAHGTTYRLSVLGLGFVTAALNLFVIEPKATSVLFQRYKLENESGGDDNAEARKKLQKQFGMLHGMSSLANLGNLAAAVAHVIWIGSLVSTGIAA